jgi:hypothetical protein
LESAARRRGAYDEEYLRAGLRLHTRGGRRLAKDLVKLGQKEATYEPTGSTAADKKSAQPALSIGPLYIDARKKLSYNPSKKLTLIGQANLFSR